MYTKIKAVIFDMDGVLIDAKEWHYDALNRALSHFGYEISRMDHLTTFDGLPTKRKLEMLTLERGLPRGLHSIISELKQLYTTEVTHVKCKPTFSHEYALSKLKSCGLRIGVASNSIRSTVELMMDKSNLRKYVDFIVSNEDVELPKPHPEMYFRACALLDLDPEQCLVVEDNSNGIKAAEAAGCPVLAVSGVDDVTFSNIEAALQRLEEASR